MSDKPASMTKHHVDVPVEWHFIRQEAMLASHLIGDGVTALGRAYYGEKGMGQYYLGFFSLSVGLERLLKLIVVADKAIDCDDSLSADDWVYKFHHNIIKLINHADQVSKSRKLEIIYERPNSEITKAIIKNIDAFANSHGRYSNYRCIQNSDHCKNDPISKWWNEVGEAILKDHYYCKSDRFHVEEMACNIKHQIGDSTNLIIFDENRNKITDHAEIIVRLVKVKIVQKFVRYHALSIVRWLSNIYLELSKNSPDHTHKKDFDQSWNFFDNYITDDSLFIQEEAWPKLSQ